MVLTGLTVLVGADIMIVTSHLYKVMDSVLAPQCFPHWGVAVCFWTTSLAASLPIACAIRLL